MKMPMAKYRWMIVIALLLFALIRAQPASPVQTVPDLPPAIAASATAIASPMPSPTDRAEPSSVSLPSSAQLKAPFTSQAPHANWDVLHEEACEEASLLMLKWFADGRGAMQIKAGEAEAAIAAMTNWENENLGPFAEFKSLTVAQLKGVAKQYFDLAAHVDYDIAADDIRARIAAGHPVLVPAAGRLLGNPHFKQPGPLYHMLVVTGYSGNEFITNDPGTRHGFGYRYSEDVLLNAIHDWTGKGETIERGRKAMLWVE